MYLLCTVYATPIKLVYRYICCKKTPKEGISHNYRIILHFLNFGTIRAKTISLIVSPECFRKTNVA